MPKITFSDNTNHYDMLQELLGIEEHLSSWEIEFLESLDDTDKTLFTLSEKQKAKLEAIWEKVFK